jgi:uncharacterized protein YacL
MLKRKKAGKKGLTREQVERLNKEKREQQAITRAIAHELKELDAKIRRLEKAQMGSVRII